MLKQDMPKPFLRGPVTLRVLPTELFFDIEVDPLRDICYLHGIVDRLEADNGSERFVSFFCEEPTPAAERSAFAGAFAYLSNQVDSVIYYYSKYERTIYRKLQAKYPDVCTADDVERLFEPPRAVDLYFDVVEKATEWPTRDHGLKTPSLPIWVLTGATSTLQGQHRSNGLIPGFAIATQQCDSEFWITTRMTAGQRASCWTVFVLWQPVDWKKRHAALFRCRNGPCTERA
jgi:hypothetical protein